MLGFVYLLVLCVACVLVLYVVYFRCWLVVGCSCCSVGCSCAPVVVLVFVVLVTFGCWCLVVACRVV